ncbi:E3 ubiquitin-protein ligase herc2, variant 2 [Balamuthia mandrillaris]
MEIQGQIYTITNEDLESFAELSTSSSSKAESEQTALLQETEIAAIEQRQKEEQESFDRLSEREKRALVAERRLQPSSSSSSSSVLSYCAVCGSVLGLVPFVNGEWQYCSMACVREHRPKRQPQLRMEEDLHCAVSIACGASHTAVATGTGAVYTYGSGRYGQLGHGDKKDKAFPHLVEALREHDVIKVACGREHTVAVTRDNKLFLWGNRVDWTGSGTKVPQLFPEEVDLQGVAIAEVACGAFHTAVLTQNGELYVWGEYSIEHTNAHKKNDGRPVLISDHVPGHITHIACGPHQTLALTDEDKVWGWGGGVLKYPMDSPHFNLAHNRPMLIESLSGLHIAQLACSDYMVVAVSSEGEVFTCYDLDFFAKPTRAAPAQGQRGYYSFYAFADESDYKYSKDDKPHRIETHSFGPLFGKRIRSVTVSRQLAMAVTESGDVFSWTLGDPWHKFENYSPPSVLSVLQEQELVVSGIACGGEQTALLVDGSITLANAFRTLVNNSWLSDITIQCDDDGKKLLHAHKRLVVARCPSVRPLFKGEEEKKIWKLEQNSYEAILALLYYLYCDRIPSSLSRLDNVEQGNFRSREAWIKELRELAQQLELSRLEALCSRTITKGQHITIPASTLAADLASLLPCPSATSSVHQRNDEQEAEKKKQGEEEEEEEEKEEEEQEEHEEAEEALGDVTFICDGERITAHKIILSSTCEYFRTMFMSGMIESDKGEITMPNVEPNALRALLGFLYTDSLDNVDANTAIDLIGIADEVSLSSACSYPCQFSSCSAALQCILSFENSVHAASNETSL